MIKQPVVEIRPRTWLISDFKLANMYLLEGDDAALLIDTGSGLGDLPGLIRSLTDKQLQVAITHGHLDHVGGNGYFGKVMMHPADRQLAEDMTNHEALVSYVESRGAFRNPEVPVEDLLALLPDSLPDFEWIDLYDGQVIELGNRAVEVIHIPGHSLGHVAFIDHGARLCYTGDMCNDSLLLGGKGMTTTVAVYAESMRKLWEREGDFDAVCLGHDALDTFDKNIIKEYIEASERLVNGEAAGEESSDGLHDGVSYIWKRARIFYDPDMLK